ncbi:MAG: CoA-binding protein [Caldilineaceae bacterium]
MGSGTSLVCDIRMNSVLTPEQQAQYQNPATIRRILADTKTIAMVGLSKDPQRPSYFVASYLKYEGYRVIPVNPTADEILGERAYPDLLSVAEPVDLVDIFRPAPACDEIVEQAIAIGAKAVWMQLRIVNLNAAKRAEAAGLDVIIDRCVKMEHGRYNGSLHWVGMNTEIVTAKKARRFF